MSERPGLPWLAEAFEEAKHPRGHGGRWIKLGRGSSRSVYVFDHGGDLTKTETFGAALDPGDREWASVRFPPGTEPGLQNGENLDWHPTLGAAKAAVEPRARRAAPKAPSAPEDTPQQKAILRQHAVSRRVRAMYPPGTRIESTSGAGGEGRGVFGEVLRHVPGVNAQGGHLTVKWDNGHTGRISPGSVRRAS